MSSSLSAVPLALAQPKANGTTKGAMWNWAGISPVICEWTYPLYQVSSPLCSPLSLPASPIVCQNG
jgi:hypothetical protein